MKTMQFVLWVILLAGGPVMAQDKAEKLYTSGQYAALRQYVQEANLSEPDRNYWKGQLEMTDKKYDDAANYLEKAVKANENDVRYQLALGNAYAQQAVEGNMITKGLLAPKIRTTFEQVHRLDPTNSDALVALINFYVQAPSFMGGDTKRALALAQEFKKVNPTAGSLALAELYAQQNQPANAESELRQAVQADPHTYRTTYTAATYLVKNSQYSKAFALYDEFLKQNPGNMLATYQIGKLAALSGTNLQRGEECLMAYVRGHKPVKDDPSQAAAVMRIGMIYEKRGNLDQAKKYYQTALGMDNNLREAKDGLARL